MHRARTNVLVHSSLYFCNVHIYKDADDEHYWTDRDPCLISVAGANEHSHIHNLCTYIYIYLFIIIYL